MDFKNCHIVLRFFGFLVKIVLIVPHNKALWITCFRTPKDHAIVMWLDAQKLGHKIIVWITISIKFNVLLVQLGYEELQSQVVPINVISGWVDCNTVESISGSFLAHFWIKVGIVLLEQRRKFVVLDQIHILWFLVGFILSHKRDVCQWHMEGLESITRIVFANFRIQKHESILAQNVRRFGYLHELVNHDGRISFASMAWIRVDTTNATA